MQLYFVSAYTISLFTNVKLKEITGIPTNLLISYITLVGLSEHFEKKVNAKFKKSFGPKKIYLCIEIRKYKIFF